MFGATGLGVADDYTPVQLWLDFGGGFATAGTFRNGTASWTVDTGRVIFGAGRDANLGSVFVSDIVGLPLFKPADDSVGAFYFADFRCDGNGVSGAGGSGHCFSWIDPTSGGSWTPQTGVMERIEIRDFLGTDNADRAGVTKIGSAGVMMYQPLHLVLRDIHVIGAKHGFYIRDTQNCRLDSCIVDGGESYGIFAYQNVNLIVENCDITNCGDGVTDTGYPEASLGTGGIGSFKNKGSVWRDNKAKDMEAGTAVVHLRYAYGDVWDGNWIRGSATTDSPHKAFYAYRSPGLKVINNTFSPANTGFARDYETIELYNDQTAEVFDATITGNKFEDPSGQNVTYNIKIGGNSTSRAYKLNITDNFFGELVTLSAASVTTNDILLSNCAVRHSSIGRNTHYAATNCTRTACVAGSSLTNEENNILASTFSANGGTITAEYSGITESILHAYAAYNPTSLDTGTRVSTTIAVTGAVVGDLCVPSFALDLQGIELHAYVSAADTVTAVFINNTGGTIDLASNALRVRVFKTAGAAI
jgi:hypothetical protein